MALWYLILGEQRVAYSSQQHEADQDWDSGLGRHLGRSILFRSDSLPCATVLMQEGSRGR